MDKIEIYFSGNKYFKYFIFPIFLAPLIVILILLILRNLTMDDLVPVIIAILALIPYLIVTSMLCFNMAIKIEIDNDKLYIWKSKKAIAIPFSYVKHITYSTGKLGGIHFFWVRKKDETRKIETSFFTISTLRNKDKRILLLNELEKKVKLKKSKII
jgi:hypothetical protein